MVALYMLILGGCRASYRNHAPPTRSTPSPQTRCAPSPRLRGEGGGEGVLRELGLWRIPLTRRASRVDLSPQAGRGEARGPSEGHSKVRVPCSYSPPRPGDR